MKVSSLMKVATVVALGCGAVLITGSIMAQKQQPGPQAAAPVAGQAILGGAGQDVMTKSPYTKPDPDSPRYGFMDTQNKDGVLTVAAQINIIFPDIKHYSLMWVVTITDRKTKELVHTQRYPDEMFQTQPDVLKKAMFLDNFDVGPGDFDVELNLCRVAPGMDPFTVGANPRKFTQCGFVGMQPISSTAPKKD